MRAAAHLAVARTEGGRLRITRLYSEPPLVLRPTNPPGPHPLAHWFPIGTAPVWASLVAGAAGGRGTMRCN